MSDGGLADMLKGAGAILGVGGIGKLYSLWAKHKLSREQQLEQREAGYVAKLEARLAAVEARVDEQESEIADAKRKATLAGQVCIMAIDELERSNPASVVIAHGRRVLMREFPELFDAPGIPPDMQSQLDQIK